MTGPCARHGAADLRVKALLVAHAVEGAIVSGLEEHLVDEVPLVEAFLRGTASALRRAPPRGRPGDDRALP